mgnify:CR=1 FL=1
MARIRGQAFLATGQAEICAVVSQHLETARVCAAELDCSLYGDDIRYLAEGRPDAVLIETPHKAQDEIAVWALEEDLDLLTMVGRPPLTPDHLIDIYVEDDVV